jgi:AraC-like DNA-binding protein
MSALLDENRPGTVTKQSRGSDASLETVHADILKFFPDLVTDLGGDPILLLSHFGKTLADLLNTEGGVSYRLMVDLLEHAATERGCADFGLRLAARQGGTNVYGPMGTVMKNSNTFGEALAYVGKHAYAHSLVARIRLERRNTDQSIFVGHDILLEHLPSRRQAIEQILLLGHLGAKEMTGGQARVRKVYFRHQPLSPLSTYRRHFGCEVRFNQPKDGVVFSHRDLQSPIIEANPKAFEAATSLIDTSFTRVAPPLHVQVRGLIGQFLGTQHCHIKHIAAELGLHPRTLHRRLQAEGKSFQHVKDEVRRDVALDYLRHTDLDLTQIAERLGYAEHSVFTRRCVHWFSIAPSHMRN